MRSELLFLSIAVVAVACGRSNRGADSDTPAGGSPGGAGEGGGATGSSGTLQPSADCKQPPAHSRCTDGFCRVEAGCFVMGSPTDEPLRGARSSGQVQVTLTRAFEIAATELTREQWQTAGFMQPKQYAQYGVADCLDADCPQGNVTFFDALAFSNRLSEWKSLAPCYILEGCTGTVGDALSCTSLRTSAASVYDCVGYRLPTEAEFEFAARAGTTTPFFSGPVTPRSDLDCYPDESLDAIGWFCANSESRPHRVAQKQANAWGLFDVAGNVNEWCNDVYKPAGYGNGPLIDPTGLEGDASQLTIRAGERFRVSRSGDYLMPAYASKHNWHNRFPDAAFGANGGIRLARTLPKQP